MATSDSLFRQLSTKNGWKSRSRRWGDNNNNIKANQIHQLNNIYGKKRVMVVIDQSPHSKNALMWALTHVANDGDILTLLHIVCKNSDTSHLAAELASLCKTSRPEVEIEALVIQGPKMPTVISQVKKLEISVLILGQRNPSPLLSCLCFKSSTEKFVEQCINTMECLTIGVGKQSQGVGGYLISTRWHKNFWLLA